MTPVYNLVIMLRRTFWSTRARSRDNREVGVGKGDRLGELEAMVLASVLHAGDDANGAGVYRELTRRGGRDPGVASIHVTLRRLEDKGLLESSVGTPSPRGGRPRRFYSATPSGLDSLATFRRMWEGLLTNLPLPGAEGAG